jgi:hypothetical protein
MKINKLLLLVAFSGLLMVLFGCRKANFDADYIAVHKDGVFIEVPEVSELAFVIVALTDYSDHNKWHIYKESAYYNDVIKHFGKYKDEAIVRKFDAAINRYEDFVLAFEIETYSYEFDSDNFIKRKKNFKSEAIAGINLVNPYIDEMQAFADKTNFRAFYKAHQSTYDAQIAYYRDTANFPKMVDWCETNFPNNEYDAFRIIFSPLTYANQSTLTVSNNGFSEPHLNVNYPYFNKKITESTDIRRTPYVFTELNHNFIGPEVEKYKDRIKTIFKDRSKWQDLNNKTTSSYKKPLDVFEEYMNWALVSLWYLDNSTNEDQTNEYISDMENTMVKGRGFTQFVGFNQEFIRLYKAKQPAETVASLFPKIIDWCEQH